MLDQIQDELDSEFDVFSVPIHRPSCPSTSRLNEESRVSLFKIPFSMETLFLLEAQENLSKNIEFLGFLLGVSDEATGEKRVTDLLIPKQSCTTTYCEMEESDDQLSQLHSYIEDRNVIFLGWIHTHPLFDNFLSSVDMHTQYQRQQMTPGNIAMVYSGITKDYKAYILTDLGLSVIGNCTKNPPMSDLGVQIDVLKPHQHTSYVDSDLYKEVKYDFYDYNLVIKDLRI